MKFGPNNSQVCSKNYILYYLALFPNLCKPLYGDTPLAYTRARQLFFDGELSKSQEDMYCKDIRGYDPIAWYHYFSISFAAYSLVLLDTICKDKSLNLDTP